MYVDKDSLGTLAIMQMNQFDIYVLTEALTRLASNPEISQDKRDRSKTMAVMINNEIIKK